MSGSGYAEQITKWGREENRVGKLASHCNVAICTSHSSVYLSPAAPDTQGARRRSPEPRTDRLLTGFIGGSAKKSEQLSAAKGIWDRGANCEE